MCPLSSQCLTVLAASRPGRVAAKTTMHGGDIAQCMAWMASSRSGGRLAARAIGYALDLHGLCAGGFLMDCRSALRWAQFGMTALCALAFAAPPAQARTPGMVALPASQAHCAKATSDGAYCYEWRLVADPMVRIVSSGYEDGGSVVVYRRDARGRYRRLAEILPALRDARYPGRLFWGYSWDIEDIEVVVRDGSVRFMATFDHPALDRELALVESKPGTRALVLFVGKTTQPDMKLEPAHFRELSVDRLRR